MPTQDKPSQPGKVSNLKPGKDTNSSKNRFQVGPIFQYPVDLNNNELKHYITFELIGRGKSETTKNSKGLQQVKANPDNANLTEDQRSGLSNSDANIPAPTAPAATAPITNPVLPASDEPKDFAPVPETIPRTFSVKDLTTPVAA